MSKSKHELSLIQAKYKETKEKYERIQKMYYRAQKNYYKIQNEYDKIQDEILLAASNLLKLKQEGGDNEC